MVNIFKNVNENIKLIKERNKLRIEKNTYENKYNTTLEKYVEILEDKVNTSDRYFKYKDLSSELKAKIKELKQQNAIANENLENKSKIIDKAIELIEKETKSMPTNGCKIRLKEVQDILKEK